WADVLSARRGRRPEPAHQLRAFDPPGAARKPARGAEQSARDPRPADPRGARTTQRLLPGASALLHDARLGTRRPGAQHGYPARAVRTRCAGTDALALLPG